jgi:hypothetical protein
MALSILGIAIGAAGLVSLWPSISTEPLPLPDPAQPFLVPFKVTNSGYLPIKDLRGHCYIDKIRVGDLNVENSVLSGWEADYLARGESMTMMVDLIDFRIPAASAEADIAIVVDYKPLLMPFVCLRGICRFVGHHEATWQWFQQASAELKRRIRASLEKHP